jgi:NADH-quinone oxidoreductase subunit E
MTFSAEARERLTAEATQIIARYPQARSALLPMLHLVQSENGYVSPDGIALCAELLDLSTAQVSAVATFYTQYKRHPNGEYTVGVCINTLCAVMGGDAIFESLEEHLGIGHDETTEDGKITLERVECNAACDYAPVVMVNWEFFDNQTPASAREICDRIRAGRAVSPTRGANTVVTFKEMSHVLAGFDDGRANEGVGAGTPSQRGTVLAEQMGWRAPAGKVPDGAGAPTTPADTVAAATDVAPRGARGSGADPVSGVDPVSGADPAAKGTPAAKSTPTAGPRRPGRSPRPGRSRGPGKPQGPGTSTDAGKDS